MITRRWSLRIIDTVPVFVSQPVQPVAVKLSGVAVVDHTGLTNRDLAGKGW